jgi:glycosyltransferase involved in cell wall biosynthesis
MLEGKRVAIVVPAHDEEKLIGETVRGIPEFVDRIYVVDDRSTDGTVAAVRALADPRVELIEHERNLGVGGAILTGYKRARDDRMDVTAAMAADAQMDPDDLETLAGAVARGEVDYAKANRLFTGPAWEVIPRYRYLGNAVLSLLTRSPPATGTSPTRSPATPPSRCSTSSCSTSTGSTTAAASRTTCSCT